MRVRREGGLLLDLGALPETGRGWGRGGDGGALSDQEEEGGELGTVSPALSTESLEDVDLLLDILASPPRHPGLYVHLTFD